MKKNNMKKQSSFLRNRKGTEKPIEIFMALFVILAVSMVLLKMFSGQIAEKTDDLNKYSERQNALDSCGELCAAAKNNGCRVEDQIRFCKKYFELDFDDNSEIGLNEEYPFQMCEDRIYCPIVSECECGQKLNINKCKEIMTRHYKEEFGMTNAEVDTQLRKDFVYTDGLCENSSNSWIEMYGIY